jgi:molybdate transport system substrate-binding protein
MLVLSAFLGQIWLAAVSQNALSRRKQGFESPRERQQNQVLSESHGGRVQMGPISRRAAIATRSPPMRPPDWGDKSRRERKSRDRKKPSDTKATWHRIGGDKNLQRSCAGLRGVKVRNAVRSFFDFSSLGGVTMNTARFNAIIIVCSGILAASSANLRAAEIRLLAGGAMASVWADIKPQFERASGHTLEIFFGTTPNLIKEATAGKPFDVGVVPVEVMQDTAARAKFVAGPTIDIARVGLGVAVRSGAPKPDISTADALKATLLKAQSVASIPESAAGYSIARVFDRLGITEPMKAKMKAQPTPAQVVAVVAKGEAELGIFLINVLTAPGLDIVGPFPAELQENVVFTAAVAANAKDAAAAKSLIEYLKGPSAVSIIKSKGMNPS